MSEQFMIGWGEADITPSNPKVELAGQYYQRVATGIHSRISRGRQSGPPRGKRLLERNPHA